MLKTLHAGLTLVVLVLATNGYAQETRTYYSTDALGSPALATDESGNVIWNESYTPFGERITSSAAAFDNGRWFTGAPQNVRSGLIDLGNRQYDPVIGRFLGIDPAPIVARDPFSVNKYAYTRNSPFNYVDPDGNFGKGKGFTDWQWKVFDRTQKNVAKDMRKTASNLFAEASKLDSRGKSGGVDLEIVAYTLLLGVMALEDDGSLGFIANGLTMSQYQALKGTTKNGAAGVDPNNRFVVNVNLGSKGWKNNIKPVNRKWILGHESLHTEYAGLKGEQKSNNVAAYRDGLPPNRKAYEELKGTPKALLNPDHLMDYVY